MDFWSKAWDNGVLAVILLGFGWGVWQVVRWTRDNVATPIIASHLELLQVLRNAIPEQTEAVTSSKAQIDKQTLSLTGIEMNIKDIAATSFEHLGLQRTEMVHLEEIKAFGKEQVELLRQQGSAVADHHRWAEQAVARVSQQIDERSREKL
jgi:hypothetical protein